MVIKVRLLVCGSWLVLVVVRLMLLSRLSLGKYLVVCWLMLVVWLVRWCLVVWMLG